ncbi:MAG: hypothetical protein NTX33_00395 [Propionibacteriales bacterium]|nr:hypothetical protein [Propionibacteriales bacterium]
MSRSDGPRELVVVLAWRGRIGLFKGGGQSEADAGLWRCLHDVLQADEDAVECAAHLVLGATGLAVSDLEDLCPGPVVLLRDNDGQTRLVRTVLARTDRRRLLTDQSDLAHRWVPRERLARFDGQVSWLRQVIDAVLGTGPAGASADGPAATESGLDLQPVAT